MIDRIAPMTWTREMWMHGGTLKPAHMTITVQPSTGKRVNWIVYEVGEDNFRIGCGIPREHGLHVVIGTAVSELHAKTDVRDVAHRLGHEW